MSDTRNRDPRGIPSGGQFAAGKRAESQVSNLSMPAQPDVPLDSLDLGHGETYDVSDRFAGTGVTYAEIESTYDEKGNKGHTLRTSVSIGDPLHHIPRKVWHDQNSDVVDNYVRDRFGASFDSEAATVDFETDSHGENAVGSVNALVERAKANPKLKEAADSIESASTESFEDGLKRYL